MKTITTNIYSFEELSEQAQKNAIENYKNVNLEFAWGEDYLETIRKGLDLFGAKLGDFAIYWDSPYSSYAKFSFYDSDNEDLKGEDLRHYLTGLGKGEVIDDTYYKITGFCADFDFIDPIRAYLESKNNENNLRELLEYCVNSVIDAGCSDYEGTQEDESIIEQMTANGYEFTENGDII